MQRQAPVHTHNEQQPSMYVSWRAANHARKSSTDSLWLSIFVLSKYACTEILKTNPMQHQGTRWHLLSKAVHARIISKTGSEAQYRVTPLSI
jgi:hypothetical protein